ncbi:MAG: SDR family NAD(P)-dependent oxidoreductase [Eggerthellaceae bacterium]|nr:SDR family NAD(P)-dependent oxidoreductase [Eggerthellaceae bacterium]
MITYDFSHKVVVVTGSARGIGRRIAERFYEAGAKVALCSISKTGKEELMQEIAGDDRSRIMALPCDVSQPEDIANFLQAVVDKFGTIDVLVNNAGIYSKEDTRDVTEAQFDKVLDANLKSVFFACQWFFKHHIDAGTTGNVVNIASVSSVTYVPDNALYNVSKAGVVTLTKTFARDMGKHGIRVNAVGPGSIPTDLNAALYADPQKEIDLCKKIPLGRRGTKDDIANCVLFLASEESDYLTGQVIYAEGGWLLV